MTDRDQLMAVARQCWLDYKSAQNQDGVYPISGSFWEISGFNRPSVPKTISGIYPIYITCTDALPILDVCQFHFLVISLRLDEKIVQEIDKLSSKKTAQFQMQFAPNCYETLFPELINDFLQKDGSFQAILAQLLNDLMSKKTSNLDKATFVRNPPIELKKAHSRFGASLISFSTSGRMKISHGLSGETTKFPSKQHLKSRCKFLHKYFFNQYFRPDIDTPAHIGWVTFGHFPRFQRAARVPVTTLDMEAIFPQAIDHVTLPLFAYSLFSTLKPFVSGYPARLSIQEPYIAVQKKLKHVIFLSVGGERALEYSAFYTCSAPIRAVPSTHTKHIHDGVVIYTRKSKNESIRDIQEESLSKFLIQDACALFVNTKLPTHNGKMSIYIPETVPKLTKPSPIASMLQSFTDWIETRYFESYEKAYYKCVSLIYKEFLNYYKRAAKEFFPASGVLSKNEFTSRLPKHPFLSYDFIIKDLVGAFSELDRRELSFTRTPATTPSLSPAEANKMITFPQVSAILAGTHRKHRKIPSIDTNAPTSVARCYAEFYCSAKEQYSKHQKSVSLRIVNYKNALRILTHNQNVDQHAAKNSAYLLAALLSYCEFLEQSDKEDADVFRQRSIQAICNFCAKGPADFTVDKATRIFHKYLSGLIVDGKIIPLRGEPQGRPISGWYDGNKKLVYLPYATYFEDFAAYCAKEDTLQIPYTKATFQELVLYPKGIVQPKENGSASQYFRPDCKIKVAPVSMPSAPAETVVKLSIPALERVYPFSKPVWDELNQMSCALIKRRAVKPKEYKFETL